MEFKKDSKDREHFLALGLRTNFCKQTEQMYAWVPFITSHSNATMLESL